MVEHPYVTEAMKRAFWDDGVVLLPQVLERTWVDLVQAGVERNLRNMPDLADLRIVRAKSTADACKGADIVTTVTADKRNAVILTPPMIAPGMHLNAVGGDCPGKTELHADVLRLPGTKVVVEYEPQSRIEGEIQQMEPGFAVTELSDVVRGTASVRQTPDDITIFDSVGFALEDYSALRLLHSLLREERGQHRTIDLVPELDDPKDLYGGTLGRGAGRGPRVAGRVGHE